MRTRFCLFFRTEPNLEVYSRGGGVMCRPLISSVVIFHLINFSQNLMSLFHNKGATKSHKFMLFFKFSTGGGISR